VRADEGRGGEFIPALSVTLGLGLALLCVGLLIFFIHHTVVSLQVATIVDAIRRDLRAGMERLYPATVAAAAAVGRERSLEQDFLLGIRQLVDIALKALSPGINDPTTAEHCLAHLGDTVAQLATRPFPSPWREDSATGVLLLVARPDFAAIVEAAFGQIRREVADDPHVTAAPLGTLATIGTRVERPERASALRHQIAEVLAALDRQPFTPADQRAICEHAAMALAVLDAPR
jgi:uncharacterized membrane protein